MTNRSWFRHLGRTLALVVQLATLFVPLAEGREEHLLASHVEAPRSTPHLGHRADPCPACILLAVHSRPEDRVQVDGAVRDAGIASPVPLRFFIGGARARSNTSRAPPLSV